jgi:hypothetical protein
MPRYQFLLNTTEDVGKVGVVQSPSFEDALTAINERMHTASGDLLEIWVDGFPPARYSCVVSLDGRIREWVPRGQLAA